MLPRNIGTAINDASINRSTNFRVKCSPFDSVEEPESTEKFRYTGVVGQLVGVRG